MISALAALLGCQLAGEIFVRALGLPLPGPVAGLGLMFAFLVWHGSGAPEPERSVPEELGRVGDAFLRNLSLLFIPAAVGVVQYLGLLRHYWWQIAIAIAASTTLALLVTAVTFRLVSRLDAIRVEKRGGTVDVERQP